MNPLNQSVSSAGASAQPTRPCPTAAIIVGQPFTITGRALNVMVVGDAEGNGNMYSALIAKVTPRLVASGQLPVAWQSQYVAVAQCDRNNTEVARKIRDADIVFVFATGTAFDALRDTVDAMLEDASPKPTFCETLLLNYIRVAGTPKLVVNRYTDHDAAPVPTHVAKLVHADFSGFNTALWQQLAEAIKKRQIARPTSATSDTDAAVSDDDAPADPAP